MILSLAQLTCAGEGYAPRAAGVKLAMAARNLLPLFAVLAILFTAGCQKKAAPTQGGATPSVTVAKPMAVRLSEWDEFTGRLASVAEVEVRARVSGYLQSTEFKEGTEVKEGDLLFVIDPRRYEAELARAKAQLAQAQSELALATSEAERATKLVQTRAISLEQSDAKVTARDSAAAALAAARAAVDATQLEVDWTRVTAPISGRISRKLVTEGNLIIGGPSGSTTLLTTIVALDPIYCYFDVDERSALKYRELSRQGKRPSALSNEIPAQMGLANQDGYPHEGKVDFVDNVINPTTGAIRARGVFPNADRLMAPGFFARVRIPGSGEYDALLVRDTALGSDQGKPFVYVVEADGKAARRNVETGGLHDGLRIVRSGLTPADRVIVNGLMAVRTGGSVKAEEIGMQVNAVAAVAAP